MTCVGLVKWRGCVNGWSGARSGGSGKVISGKGKCKKFMCKQWKCKEMVEVDGKAKTEMQRKQTDVREQ